MGGVSARPWWWVVVLAVVGALLATAQLVMPDDDTGATATRFGLSVPLDPTGSRPERLDHVTETIGAPEVVRVFNEGLPASWATLEAQFPGKPLVVSFKADPAEVVDGRYDAALRAWFDDAPTDRPIWWAYFHEPENDVDAGAFEPADFRAAWSHVAALAEEAGNPALHPTMVLMCWTVNPRSDRDLADYARPDMGIEVLAWDCYNHGARVGRYTDPEVLLHHAVEASLGIGAGWGVAELGSLPTGPGDGHRRAAWLQGIADYARRHQAEFVTYFHSTVGGYFLLTDPESIQAWAEAMRG